MRKEGRHIMPRTIAFKDVPEGEFFLLENDESDPVLYKKRAQAGFPYECWHEGNGNPTLYPAAKATVIDLPADRPVYRLACRKNG
jgi:hypothetical protein